MNIRIKVLLILGLETTAAWTGTRLEVTNTGNVVLSELPGGTVLWETNAFCPSKYFDHCNF